MGAFNYFTASREIDSTSLGKVQCAVVHKHIKHASFHNISSRIVKVEFKNPPTYFAKICPLSVDPQNLVVHSLEEI